VVGTSALAKFSLSRNVIVQVYVNAGKKMLYRKNEKKLFQSVLSFHLSMDLAFLLLSL